MTQTSPPAPRPQPLQPRAGARLARLLAAAALLCVLAGVPTGLVVFVGNPLPDTLPTWHDLTAPVTEQGIIDGFAIALWAYWIQFAACLGVEAGAVLTGRSRAPRIPLAGPNQLLAHVLLGAIVATAAARGTQASPATVQAAVISAEAAADATTAPARTGPSAADREARPASAHPEPGRDPVTCQLWTVERTDTLWEIAERCLGDGRRYSEIFDLNAGRRQPDGGRLTNAQLIHPGWILALPTGSGGDHDGLSPVNGGRTVIVTPGDTLWDLAEAEYGSGLDYRLVYAANAGRPQPDGGALADPDLIQPGWQILLPSPPSDGKPSTSPTTPDPTHAPAPAATTTEPSPPRPALPPAAPAEPTYQATEATQPPTPSQTPATPSSGIDQAERDDDEPANWLWEITGYGVLAAATIVAVLTALRSVQQRRRPAGARIRMPADEVSRLERLSRAFERPPAADFLDRALRTLSLAVRDADRTLPALRSARLATSGLYLQLDTPAEPVGPFAAVDEDQQHWHCPVTAALADYSEAQDVPAPYPALVTLGHDADGAAVLVDLEQIRNLAVTGPELAPVLRALAVELAGGLIADHLDIIVVGVAAELIQAGFGTLREAADLDRAIDELDQWAATTARALQRHGLVAARDARSRRAFSDVLSPRILVSAVPLGDAQRDRLSQILAAEPAGCVAAITVTPVSPRSWILPAQAGQVSLIPTGHRLTAQRIDDDTYRQLIEHLRTASDTTPPSEIGDWWPTARQHARRGGDSSSGEPARESMNQALSAPEATPGAAELGGRSAVPPARQAPDDAQPLDPQSPGALPTRDDQPEVRLLGPVELVRTRGRLHEPGKRSRLTEIAAWLVLHRGSDYASLTEAIWPEGTSTSNRNTTISKLRAWLGTDDHGQPYLPLVSEHGSYTLADGVGCDWYHFQHLVRTGLARGGDAGARDLQRALDLVRGAPISPVLAGRYGWAERVRHDMTSAIVDAATALATRRLSASDWAGAMAATGRGIAAVPGDERLYRLLFQAAARAGDQNTFHHAIVELERYNEAHGLEIDQETLDLLAVLVSEGFGRLP